MTGEEHAQAAELMMAEADTIVGEATHTDEEALAGFHMVLARAQVHATLALVDAVKALAPTRSPWPTFKPL